MINVKTLRTLRTDRGYSIRALAAAAGVDHQTIRRLELGSDPDVPLRVLDRIAEALGVPAATLLDDSPDVEHRPLEQEIGGIVLGTPNVSVSAVAATLAISIEEVRDALAGLRRALSACGLTLVLRGDSLRITPATPHPTTAANTTPMSLNEARLLRRIEGGEDVRRHLSKTDRELTLPALTRRGLVNVADCVPVAASALSLVAHDPAASALRASGEAARWNETATVDPNTRRA